MDESIEDKKTDNTKEKQRDQEPILTINVPDFGPDDSDADEDFGPDDSDADEDIKITNVPKEHDYPVNAHVLFSPNKLLISLQPIQAIIVQQLEGNKYKVLMNDYSDVTLSNATDDELELLPPLPPSNYYYFLPNYNSMDVAIPKYPMLHKSYLLVTIEKIENNNDIYVIKYQQNSFIVKRYQLYTRKQIENQDRWTIPRLRLPTVPLDNSLYPIDKDNWGMFVDTFIIDILKAKDFDYYNLENTIETNKKYPLWYKLKFNSRKTYITFIITMKTMFPESPFVFPLVGDEVLDTNSKYFYIFLLSLYLIIFLY